MVVSFVVRLIADDLHAGAIAGEVHNVATGEQVIVRNFEDLLAALRRGAAPRAELGETRP